MVLRDRGTYWEWTCSEEGCDSPDSVVASWDKNEVLARAQGHMRKAHKMVLAPIFNDDSDKARKRQYSRRTLVESR